MKYRVSVWGYIEVEADSYEEAVRDVEWMCEDGFDDLQDVKFGEVVEPVRWEPRRGENYRLDLK